MAAQLNIKDPETIRLAREQAARSGKSITAVIRAALENEDRRHEEDIQARWEVIKKIQAEFRAALPPEARNMTSKEMMDDLYDDDGLPI